jgi:ATP-binding cassette, subfamily F, member 3
MPGAPEAKVRSRCARIGFPNIKADTPISLLSGGEKARLVMGLASFYGPHLLILDEPTNHLDIDSRAALIEAINEYSGAVILVSHDRHLLGACADRLWLVAEGSVKPFQGDMEAYERYVLDKAGGPKRLEPTKQAKATAPERRPPSSSKTSTLKKRVAAAEEKIKKFQDLIARVDEALADPNAFMKEPAKAAQLSKQRIELERALETSEEEWLLLASDAEMQAE